MYGVWCMVYGVWFMVYGARFRVSCSASRFDRLGFTAREFGSEASGKHLAKALSTPWVEGTSGAAPPPLPSPPCASLAAPLAGCVGFAFRAQV